MKLLRSLPLRTLPVSAFIFFSSSNNLGANGQRRSAALRNLWT